MKHVYVELDSLRVFDSIAAATAFVQTVMKITDVTYAGKNPEDDKLFMIVPGMLPTDMNSSDRVVQWSYMGTGEIRHVRKIEVETMHPDRVLSDRITLMQIGPRSDYESKDGHVLSHTRIYDASRHSLYNIEQTDVVWALFRPDGDMVAFHSDIKVMATNHKLDLIPY